MSAAAQLERLADFLVEDVLAMSDEEVLAEMAEEGVYPEALAREMREEIDRAIVIHHARQDFA